MDSKRGATGGPVAGGRRPDLWAGQAALSAPTAGGRYASAALRDTSAVVHGPYWARAEWTDKHGVYRAGQSDHPAERGSPDAPDVVDSAASTAVAAPFGMVACVLPLCPAT